MPHIQIKLKFSDKVLFEGEYSSTKEAVKDAVARKADLSGAYLSGADLSGINLSGINLSGADLSGAYLSGADLSGTNLSGAYLSGADLFGANLSLFKQDLIAEVLKLPSELEGLKEAIIAGKIDGSSYSGECACLAGTFGNLRGIRVADGSLIRENFLEFSVNSNSPREKWFMNISEGDTPESNQCAKLALDWVNEAIAIRDNICAIATKES